MIRAMGEPTIVCLCGSTRFKDEFARLNYEETLAGNIVLTIGCDTKSDEELAITPEQKRMLDELHLAKVRIADRIIVINKNGYVGHSTMNEIAQAVLSNRPISWLEPETGGDKFLEKHSHDLGRRVMLISQGQLPQETP